MEPLRGSSSTVRCCARTGPVTGAAAATAAVNAAHRNRKYLRRPGIESTERSPVIVAARLIGLEKTVRGYQKGVIERQFSRKSSHLDQSVEGPPASPTKKKLART